MIVTKGQVWVNKKSGRHVKVRSIKMAYNGDDHFSKVFYDNLGSAEPGKRYMRRYGKKYLDTFLHDFSPLA